MIIIAIDPGYDRLGVAVIEKNLGKNSGGRSSEILLYSTCVITDRKDSPSERLALLFTEISKIMDTYAPEALAIEALFFSKNTTTAIKVAEARGAILALAGNRGIPVFEYNPMEVKVATTGHGRSDKEHMRVMVQKLIEIKELIRYDDEYDAIAIGLTHLAHVRRHVLR